MSQLGPFEAIVWDLDGVLVDTEPDLKASFREAARAVGYGELTEEQVSNKIGGGAKKALESIFGEDSEYLAPALAHFKDYYPRHSAVHSVLYPDVLDTLDALHGKARFAVATAKIRSATLEILDKLGIVDHFDYIVTADDMTRMKPDPQSIQMVQERFGVSPRKVAMVGDMATDIQAAHAAGSTGIGVTYGYGKKDDIIAAGADMVIDTPRQIMPLFP
ncbi:HAD-IA family hydrolase [Flaviflexus huanghaiensis]|uniref:HAD-IA family hydrolase n=1 Tax=Flaviflexus huanghaiensis TaxID=1111473 RepID=UPI0015FBBE82